MLRRDTFPRKHWLLQPGRVSDRLYFVEKGVVRGYYLREGKDVTSWFMREGNFLISIVSFYSRQPAYEYMELLEDSVVWSITYAQLQQLYRDFPEFNVVGRLLTEKYYVLSELRTQNLRMQTTTERYHQLLTDFPDIFGRVPLKYIPGWKLPSVPTLTTRVLAINFVQLIIVVLAGFTWEKWLSAYSVLHLSEHVGNVAGGVIAYVIATFIFY